MKLRYFINSPLMPELSGSPCVGKRPLRSRMPGGKVRPKGAAQTLAMTDLKWVFLYNVFSQHYGSGSLCQGTRLVCHWIQNALSRIISLLRMNGTEILCHPSRYMTRLVSSKENDRKLKITFVFSHLQLYCILSYRTKRAGSVLKY